MIEAGSLPTEIAPLSSPLVSEESAAIGLPKPNVDEAPLAKRLSKKSSRLLSFEESQENKVKRPKRTGKTDTMQKEKKSEILCDDKEISCSNEVEELFCVCQVPWRKEEGDSMTFCERCHTWMHYDCAGVSKEKLVKIEHFICFQY